MIPDTSNRSGIICCRGVRIQRPPDDPSARAKRAFSREETLMTAQGLSGILILGNQDLRHAAVTSGLYDCVSMQPMPLDRAVKGDRERRRRRRMRMYSLLYIVGAIVVLLVVLRLLGLF